MSGSDRLHRDQEPPEGWKFWAEEWRAQALKDYDTNRVADALERIADVLERSTNEFGELRVGK